MDCAILSPTPAPPYVGGICNKLSKHGITYKIFDWNGFDDDYVFTPEAFSVLFIADAQNCPAFLPNKLEKYMKAGGRVVTVGGPPFENEFYSVNNEEISQSELSKLFCEGGFDKTVISPFTDESELADFKLDTTNPDSKKLIQTAHISIAECDAPLKKAFYYSIDNFYINESFEKPISVKEGHNVIGFWAKADEKTKTITVELVDSNSNVFKCCVTPSTHFEFYMLCSRDFRFSGNINGISYSKLSRPELIIEKTQKIRFGHALSHAYSVALSHEFYISELVSGYIGVLNDKRISIDGLYPPYKFYPIQNVASVASAKSQAFIKPAEFPIPKGLFSLSPRARSSGIDKARRFRFVPLIDCLDDKGLHCGYVAYMFLNFAYGDLFSTVDSSMLAVFSTSDDNFYQNGGDDAVADIIKLFLSSAFLLEGGSNEYIYDEKSNENARFGAVVLAKKDANLSNCQLKISTQNITSTYSLSELVCVKSQGDFNFLCATFEQPPYDGVVKVSLTNNEKEIDTIEHEINLYKEKPEESLNFATIKKGSNEIFIDGKAVRFFGVNYMPRCNAGMETPEEFEHYVSAFAYDPDIIKTDLLRMVDIGINAVSIFMHYEPSIHSKNILHLVELCRKLKIYVVLSIRPHANPFDFNGAEVTKMIKEYGFDKNDNIIGYDIAWERYVGTYEPCYGNFLGRKSFDEGWRDFIVSTYKSFEEAESVFGCSLTKNQKGEIISPTDDMLRDNSVDNPLAPMIAVYRRYIDNVVALYHIHACDFIKSIDKNHLITARSGDASTIPLVDPGIYGYDFAATALSLDFTAPESYALSDDMTCMRQGVFTNIYTRYANPDAVVQWMEFGKSIWTGSNFTDNSVSLKFQADYYKSFFDMLLLGHTNGLFAWWWAGGYRIGENSDFGIVSPDGSDRPVTQVFRDYSKRFLNAPPLSRPDVLIEIDRDKYADGMRSIYTEIEDTLFESIKDGHTVALIDGGNGKTTKDLPICEVGNLPFAGYLPKHLDAIMISCKAILDNGKKLALQNGDRLNVGKSKAVTLSFEMINSQSAKWLCGDDEGGVFLISEAESKYAFSLPLYSDIEKRERVSFHLSISCEEKGLLSCRLNAKGRLKFGETIKIYIE